MKGHSSSINGLRRHGVLASVVASAIIGPKGGEIHLPSAGLRVSIPEGAFASESEVTVAAHDSLLGFTIEASPAQTPAKRVRIEQHVSAHQIEAQHTEPPFLLGHVATIEEQATCTELYAGRLEGDKVVAHIRHFSGYLIATGNGYEPCDPEVITDGTCIWVENE